MKNKTLQSTQLSRKPRNPVYTSDQDNDIRLEDWNQKDVDDLKQDLGIEYRIRENKFGSKFGGILFED